MSPAASTATPPAYPDDKLWPYVAGFSNQPAMVEGPAACRVTGSIPAWVRGRLYRVGPGIYDVPYGDKQKPSYFHINHWFDGLTVVHCFEVGDGGKVTYRSKYTAEEVSKAYEGGVQPFVQFSADPCRSLLGKSMSFFYSMTAEPVLKRFVPGLLTPAVPMNIGVTVTPQFLLQTNFHSGKERTLVIKTDGTTVQPLDRETLMPQRQVSYAHINKQLQGMMGAAHEEYDTETDQYYNIAISMGAEAVLKLFEISPQAPRGQLLKAINLDAPTYLHSMFSTKKYIIVPEYPVEIGWKGLKIVWEKGLLEAMSFNANKPTLFHVVSRQAPYNTVATFTAPPMFVFHSVNAFDDGDDVVLDMCAYTTSDIIKQLQLKTLRHNGPDITSDFEFGHFERYRLPRVSSARSDASDKASRPAAVQEFVIPDMPFELARINDRFKYDSKYRYLYAVGAVNRDKRQHHFFDSIIKVDLQTKQYVQWSLVGHTPSEPIFIERPGASDEDDGVLLSVVLDGANKKSFLLCLDAKTMKELGRAEGPSVVAFGFHGAFDPATTK